MFLTKEQITTSSDFEVVVVKVPEWKGLVRIRTMSSRERDSFEQEMIHFQKGKDLPNMRAKLAAYCICDEDGIRLFSDKDIEALGQKSSKALQRVFNAALKLNAITPEEQEELKKT